MNRKGKAKIRRLDLSFNLDKALDAAIWEALATQGSAFGMTQAAKILLASALGIKIGVVPVVEQAATQLERQPVQRQLETPANITPFKTTKQDESTALEKATGNFLNAFG